MHGHRNKAHALQWLQTSREYVHVFCVAWPVIEWESAVVILSVGLDLSAPAPLFEHLTFARQHWEKTSQPERQPVRQEAIQQRS